MRSPRVLRSAAFLASASILAALGCSSGSETNPKPDGGTGGGGGTALTADQQAILSVKEGESFTIPGLEDEVHVVRTEASIPHIYAKSRKDLARVEGFVIARDRYFMMDLARRLGSGRVSELLGDSALQTDQEWRSQGAAYVTDRIVNGLTPELQEHLDSFAAGINEYIAQVKGGSLAAPSELKLASLLLGVAHPEDLMTTFERRDVAAMVAVIIYQTSYEGGDVGAAAAAASLPTLFEGADFQDLRRQGAIKDLYERIEPIMPRSSAAGFGLEMGSAPKIVGGPRAGKVKGLGGKAAKQVPSAVLGRLATKLERMARRSMRDKEAGFGSNAWAVAGSKTTDGAALLAGDGHLSLSVPSVLYNIGLDTSVFGGGPTHQLGLMIAGFPIMPIGTNGKVAWSQTQLVGDVTDWYREEIQLGADGLPAKTSFKGEWKDVVKKDEVYKIANVDLLGSVGRTETWPRFETFDGRWIADVEGPEAKPGDPVGAGEAIINVMGRYVIPKDMDGDGVITAVSFDYTGFDVVGVLPTTDALGHATDVHDFREKTKGLIAYSQNFAVADGAGNIYYTAYQTVPCRGYLPRDAQGMWMPGAHPGLLLDGTQYGAFSIPSKDGLVDEEPGKSDPYKCVVPFAETPAALNPTRGYVATANNDPGNISTDSSLINDKWYIGGPWDVGFRMDTIARELEKAIADGKADQEAMSRIQGNTQSRTGELLATPFVEAIKKGRTLSMAGGLLSPADQRIADLYTANAADFDAVETRLTAWGTAGYEARSGVETFYSTPAPADKDAAVATMIWNAWLGRALQGVFGDEPMGGVYHSFSSGGQIRGLNRFLKGRGPNNPEKLASYNPATEESIFFDVLGTPEVETSREVLLKALQGALDFLKSAPTKPGEGGFGTSDMSKWLWGLRHYVKFESLLNDFLDDPQYKSFTEAFAITTSTLPLVEGALAADDPRKGLMWFPRHGDQFSVDAANPGFGGTNFAYGSGPVMRMVVSLKGDQVTGRNIIPGGQSALTDSPFFADQAKLWLGNQTLPMRFMPKDVAAGAVSREVYKPQK